MNFLKTFLHINYNPSYKIKCMFFYVCLNVIIQTV